MKITITELCVLILIMGATFFTIGYNVGLPKAVTQEQ